MEKQSLQNYQDYTLQAKAISYSNIPYQVALVTTLQGRLRIEE